MQRPRRQKTLPLVSLRKRLLLLLGLLLSSSSWVFASLEFQLSDDTMNAFHEKNDDSNNAINDDDDESESLRRILWNTHQIQQQIKSVTSYARLHRPSPSNYLERSKNDNHKLRNVTLHISLPCEYFPLDKNQTLSSSLSSSSHPKPSTTNTTTVLVQEFTSSFMAAKALAKTVLQKTNNNNEWNLLLDDRAWSILDSLLLPPFATGNADDDDEDENIEDSEDNDHSDLFFQTQGLLPKYWYYNPPPKSHNNKHNSNSNNTPYINGTRIPHWSLFVPNITNNHIGNHTHHNATRKNDWIRSSFRLSALPLHASLLWDMMVAVIPPNTDHSSDPNDNDNDNLKSSYPYSYNYEHNREWWNRIERYYTHIFQHHMYLHHVVMRGCQPSSSSPKQQQQQDYYNTHQSQGQSQKPTPSHHNSNRPTVPCYNILHPWESLMDPTSPTWDIVLQPILQHIRDTNWHLPFVIPPLVEQSFDFPGNPLVYRAMMYLLVEGWVRKEFVVGNSTTTLAGMCQSSPSPATCAEDALLFWNTTTTTTNTSDTDSNNNTTTKSTIPFAMLDVGYAAVLAQADADLQQLARVLQMVLPENFYAADSTRRTFEQDIATIQRWQQDNDRILQHELWNETHRTYLSKYYHAASKQMVFVNAAVSNNLIPFWNTDALDHPNPNHNNDNNQDGRNGDATMTSSLSSSSSKSLVEVHSKNNNNNYNHHPSNDDAVTSISSTLSSWSETTRNHWKDLTLLLLRRDNRYAFDCGSFPLWSLGCQEEYHDSPTQKPPIIQPIVNYLVASGLLQNAEYLDTFGQYISSQSLRLFYHDNNQKPDRHHPYHVENTTTTVFADAYSAFYPNHNLASQHDICGNTSTLTAAIVYNFRVPDPTHANRLPLPPIRRSWVITLITVELFVAFSIGVSCLVLSFSQYRKLLRDSIIVEEVVGDSAANDDTFRDEEIVALNHRDYQNFAGGNLNDNENESSNNNNNISNNVTANYDATTVINATSSPPAPDDSLDETQPETSRSFFARLGFN